MGPQGNCPVALRLMRSLGRECMNGGMTVEAATAWIGAAGALARTACAGVCHRDDGDRTTFVCSDPNLAGLTPPMPEL